MDSARLSPTNAPNTESLLATPNCKRPQRAAAADKTTRKNPFIGLVLCAAFILRLTHFVVRPTRRTWCTQMSPKLQQWQTRLARSRVVSIGSAALIIGPLGARVLCCSNKPVASLAGARLKSINQQAATIIVRPFLANFLVAQKFAAANFFYAPAAAEAPLRATVAQQWWRQLDRYRIHREHNTATCEWMDSMSDSFTVIVSTSAALPKTSGRQPHEQQVASVADDATAPHCGRASANDPVGSLMQCAFSQAQKRCFNR